MMQKIKNHFLKMGPRRFVIATVVLLIVLDLINSYYLRIYWLHKDMSLMYVEKVAMTQGLNFNELSPDSVNEIKQVVDNGVFFFLFIVLINNLFFYFFYLRKKLWAQGYVLFYTISNSVLAIMFLVEGPIMGMSWFMYNLSTMFLYLYLYFGVKVLKQETTDFSHAHETKAQ